VDKDIVLLFLLIVCWDTERGHPPAGGLQQTKLVDVFILFFRTPDHLRTSPPRNNPDLIGIKRGWNV